MMKKLLLLIFASICGLGSLASGEEFKPEIRLGVLAFGTLSWEMATIQRKKLDEKNGFKLIAQTLASPQAGKIALQSGAVDMIVSDWIWVSRQRSAGMDFTFAPYSNSHGALIVPPDSNIRTLQDLKNKRLGIAGGGLDKNWLLLRGLAEKEHQLDLDGSVEKVFGAPPLLNQQLLQGKLDALMNYWHYAVPLEVKGYRRLLDGTDILRRLGIQASVPALGYVFSEAWADKHRNTVESFLKTSSLAKNLLCESNQAWTEILPLTQTDDKVVQKTLRTHYCEGRVNQWGDTEKRAAAEIYALLRKFGGDRLTGKSEQLQKGTFWAYPTR
ncbi:MAG: ABC transporter substrate-binding protein [Pseudomonadota bacterium]